MTSSRKAYPSDVSDEEWVLVAPCLTLLHEDAGPSEHSMREVFDGLRYVAKSGAPWWWMPKDPPRWKDAYQPAKNWLAAGCFAQRADDLRALMRLASSRSPKARTALLDSRPLRTSPDTGARAVCDGAKRNRGAKRKRVSKSKRVSKVHRAVDTLATSWPRPSHGYRCRRLHLRGASGANHAGCRRGQRRSGLC